VLFVLKVEGNFGKRKSIKNNRNILYSLLYSIDIDISPFLVDI